MTREAETNREVHLKTHLISFQKIGNPLINDLPRNTRWQAGVCGLKGYGSTKRRAYIALMEAISLNRPALEAGARIQEIPNESKFFSGKN